MPCLNNPFMKRVLHKAPKEKALTDPGGAFSFVKRIELKDGNVHCGRPFFPLLYLEGDTITFVQRLETASFDP